MQLRLVGLKVNVSFCTTFALHRGLLVYSAGALYEDGDQAGAES